MPKERILAAGGIVWRDASRRELLLIHRLRYDDWSLPKGKLDPDETFLAAALREVAEVVWLPVPDALSRMSYADERELVARNARG